MSEGIILNDNSLDWDENDQKELNKWFAEHVKPVEGETEQLFIRKFDINKHYLFKF